MRVTHKHINLSSQKLPNDNLREFAWQMIRDNSDQVFQDRVDLLLFQKDRGFFEKVHQLDTGQYTAYLMANILPRLRHVIFLSELQIRSIYAVLAPIYFCMQSKLPYAKSDAIDAILNEEVPDDYLLFFEQFGPYSSEWYTNIRVFMDILDRDEAKAAVWAICKVYIDALPEPLEK